MPNGIPIGSKGGVEVTYQSDETRRRIPIRTAVSIALALNVINILIYFIGWCIKAQQAWNAWRPQMYLPAWREFIRRLVYALSTVAELAGGRAFVLMVPLFVEWIAALILLILGNLLPKMLNDEWPFTHAQDDPANGYVTFWHWLLRGRVIEDGEQTVIHEIRGVVTDEQGHEWRTHWTTRYPKRWRRYCRALCMEPEWLRPAFSITAATGTIFRIPRDEFSPVSDHWLAIGYAKKTSEAQNAKRYLTGKGLAFCNGWAQGDGSTPLVPEAA